MTKAFSTLLMVLLPVFFKAQNTYSVYALKFAERTYHIKLKDIAVGAKTNDTTKVYFMYWFLKGNNGKTILVDAGFTNDFEINPKMISWSAPQDVLAGLTIKPEEITDIIITHPHWDHIGGIDLYPKAMVWMQEEDYNDFVNKADPENSGFNKKDIEKVLQRKQKGSLTLVKGDDKEILPGVKVFIGSKHTFESQFVLVNNGTDNVVLASDNCKYYYNAQNLLSSPYTTDQKGYARNLKRMRKMVKDIDLIMPGHDPLVFSKFETVAPNVVQIKK